MKAVRCSEETYVLILEHAAKRGTTITRAVDELITSSSFEPGLSGGPQVHYLLEELTTLKRIDELEIKTRALLGLLHAYHLAANSAEANQFYCQRCEEGLMDWVEESRNPEGVIDWQAYQCGSCGWAFQLTA